MKHIIAVVVTLLLFCPASGFSETKEIITEGTYNMGDGETPTVAESRALLQAKRTAVEEAGTYVESYSKTRNFQLTVDEIQVLASGVMEVEVLEKKRTVVGDGFNFWIKIKARVSTDKMEEMAKRVKEKSVVEDYKKIQEAYDKSQKEIEELKRQLTGAKGEKQKKRVEAKIADDERLLQANEWFEKGYQHHVNKEYDEAIEAYTSAIALNPNNAGAYNNRGLVYKYKNLYDKTIEDYSKAIELDPNNYAYINRGIAYGNKGQHDKAIEDYNKAIALNPNEADAFKWLGTTYSLSKGQRDRAIENYNKAIALNPNDEETYLLLGLVYLGEEKFDRAIENFNKAIAINQNYALAYYSLGSAYDGTGQYDRAIEDYNRAIVLDPNDAIGYGARGLIYMKLGNNQLAVRDLNKAIELNPEDGGGYYNMSCFYSLQKQADKACYYLDKSIEKGYKNWDWIKKDKDLDNIRNAECYKRIMKGK